MCGGRLISSEAMIKLQQENGRKCRTCGRTPEFYTGAIDDAGQCCACYCYQCSPYFKKKEKCSYCNKTSKFCGECPHSDKYHAGGENPPTVEFKGGKGMIDKNMTEKCCVCGKFIRDAEAWVCEACVGFHHDECSGDAPLHSGYSYCKKCVSVNYSRKPRRGQ